MVVRKHFNVLRAPAAAKGVDMYTLFRLLPLKRLACEQAPALALAWLIAEFFYKFHSFTLECAAFLATWFLFDVIIQAAARTFARAAGRAVHR
jgi:hypothetical protein